MALSIGQVADAADVNIQTIRYYERRGLFPTPRRTPAGYRQYADEAVARLRFIKHAQELGFSLQEIQELLALRRSEEHTSELQSRLHLVCRLLLEKKKNNHIHHTLDSQSPVDFAVAAPDRHLQRSPHLYDVGHPMRRTLPDPTSREHEDMPR